MIPGKSYRNKTRGLKTAPTAYPPPLGSRREVSQPKSWSCTDLNAHGTEEVEPQPGGQGLCPIGCTAALDLLPQSCRLAAVLSLEGRGYAPGEGCPQSGI